MHKLIRNWDCQVTAKRKLWFIISAALILVGILVVSIFGFNIGIDFSGGTVMSISASELVTDANYNDFKDMVISTLKDKGISVQINQRIDKDGNPALQVRYQNQVNGKDYKDQAMIDYNKEVNTAVQGSITEFFSNVDSQKVSQKTYVEVSNVGATASSELILNAFISVAVAAALILVYVAIRFEALSGLSAVIALIHDVLIMSAFVAIFRIQINASFVAALITIVGYSINNTIVLFDRLRENRSKYTMRDATPNQLVDCSIKDTMTRSINTSLTTLVTIAILAIIGVTQIKEFAIPIIIGLLAGTYSSIFIAPPLWGVLKETQVKRKKAKAKSKK